MMKNVLFALLAAVLLTGCNAGGRAVREAVGRQLDRYPQSTMADVYKSFYQDRFGSGHMIADTASVRAYLLTELQTAATDTVQNPYYEPVGAQGRYVRVYLRCVNEGLLTAEQLLDAFIRSAQPAEQPAESWAAEWRRVEQAARAAGMACCDEDSRQLQQAAEANRAVHHSDPYRQAYHPRYRIVRSDIFERELRASLPVNW